MDGAQRNQQLDGLRGYAALAVVFWHAMLSIDPGHALTLTNLKFSQVAYSDLFQKFYLTLLGGDTAVVLFFVLSGAVLMTSLQRESGSIAAIAVRFTIRRFFRIYPVLLFAIAFTAFALLLAGREVTSTAIVQNIVLYDATVNGGTWTLNVEMIAVVLLLLAFAAYRLFGETGLVASLVIMLAIVHAPPLKGYLVYFRGNFFCFAFGMLIPTRVGDWIYRRLPSASWPVLLLIVLFVRHLFIGVHRVPSLAQETAAALLILLLYHNDAGAFGRFLARPSSVFLGSISYSLYLLNVPFLLLVERFAPVAHPLLYGFISGTVVAALTIPVAYLALNWIEKPGISLGRKLTRRRAPLAEEKQQTAGAAAS